MAKSKLFYFGDVKIPHSTITKTSTGKLVIFLRNVYDKSQNAICTSCLSYWISMSSQFWEMFAMVINCVTDAPRWFCNVSSEGLREGILMSTLTLMGGCKNSPRENHNVKGHFETCF